MASRSALSKWPLSNSASATSARRLTCSRSSACFCEDWFCAAKSPRPMPAITTTAMAASIHRAVRWTRAVRACSAAIGFLRSCDFGKPRLFARKRRLLLLALVFLTRPAGRQIGDPIAANSLAKILPGRRAARPPPAARRDDRARHRVAAIAHPFARRPIDAFDQLEIFEHRFRARRSAPAIAATGSHARLR